MMMMMNQIEAMRAYRSYGQKIAEAHGLSERVASDINYAIKHAVTYALEHQRYPDDMLMIYGGVSRDEEFHVL